MNSEIPEPKGDSKARTTGTVRGALTNASWNAFGTLFSIVTTFLMAPLLIHRLGSDQWGLLLLVWSVTGVLGMANFGVGEATLRFIAHHHANGNMAGVNRVLGATLTFYVSICTVVSVFIFAATSIVAQWVKAPSTENYPVEWLLRLAALLFSLGMITNAFRSITMALQRYDITSRIGIGQSMARSLGLIVLALAGMAVEHMVVWELIVAASVMGVQIVVARKLLPGVQWLPNMSLSGIREIFGYSVLTFLTHLFLTIYRESGKLILGNRVGPAAVAYLGTPDSVAHRLHSVVVSGIETLMPRFSASRHAKDTKALLVTSTWMAVTCGVVLYLPLAVLMEDFLRLWINSTFARESAAVGQLLALSFIAPTAFSPIATLFRGKGKPGFVTVVMALAGSVVLASTLFLVSTHGVLGVGVGYMLSSIAWLGGLLVGWFYWFGRRSLGLLCRVSALPLMLGCGLGLAEISLHNWLGDLGWAGLIATGGAFASLNAIALFGVDRALGGDSPAGYSMDQVLRSERVAALQRRIGLPMSPSIATSHKKSVS